ncbi:MAG: TlpA disulfide reductase family protein [Terracidiphilus sp.]|jgi:peroxiredoxin
MGSQSTQPRGAVPDFSLTQVRGGEFHLRAAAGKPVLIAFLQTVPDTADTPSRNEAVFLLSMAHQYTPRGLAVVAIDESALVRGRPPQRGELINASYDWQLSFPLLDDSGNHVARRFGVVKLPTLVLIAPDGRVAQRWEGLTRPAILAQGIERMTGGRLGELPDLR